MLGAAAGAGFVDDITNGRLLARKLLTRQRTTTNVIAETGDPDAG